MAAILAKMSGNPVPPNRSDDLGGPYGIGMVAAPRIPDGRDMVDIDSEA